MSHEIKIIVQDATTKRWEFSNLIEIRKFLQTEIEFWNDRYNNFESFKDNDIHVYFKSYTHLARVIQTIKNTEEKIKDLNENQLTGHVNQINDQSRKIRDIWLWSGHSYVDVLYKTNKKYGIRVADAFINFIIKKQIANLNDKDYFIGSVLAYEYLIQDSDIAKRSISEEEAFSRLRDVLSNSKNDLVKEVDEFKNKYNGWYSSIVQDWPKWLNSNKEEHLTAQNKYKDDFNNYMNQCNEDISTLKKTYRELLRLKEPADYWSQAATRYLWQGSLWALTLVVSLAVGLFFSSNFFSLWLVGEEIELNLGSIQGVVLFSTFIAIYAFLVKALSKLTFSAFHLMRDAEERKQLTYLYLSLVNEKAADEKSRDIVFTALFSRSETGLLANESGPTMPGLSEVIRATTNR
ncbi:MAG: hypothetical protein KME48_19275 [Candidatus Thiodiazotropha sp. (ex Ctena orbiculata)]|nr:hypothetical protein [Candidatus Thiodiazotropha taylori]MBT3037030.1 hypothetical protein [Candidatus Thiodiazotropha taylori]